MPEIAVGAGKLGLAGVVRAPRTMLTAAGCDTPRLDAELLLAFVLGVGRERLVIDACEELDAADARPVRALVARREAREPVAYILGRQGLPADLAGCRPPGADPAARDRAARRGRRCRSAVAAASPTSAPAAGRWRSRSRTSGPTYRSWASTLSSDALEVARGNAHAARARRGVRAGRPARRRAGSVRRGAREPPVRGRGLGAAARDRAVRAGAGAVRRSGRHGPGPAAAGRWPTLGFRWSRSRSGWPRRWPALMLRCGISVRRGPAGPGRPRAGGRRRAGDATRGVRALHRRSAGLVLFAADTVYGLACDPDDRFAVERLYLLKRRSLDKPSAVMFFGLERAFAAVPEMGERTRGAMARLLPGAVTVLVPNPAGRFALACGADVGTLGLRVPVVPALAGVRRPVLQSSANRAGGRRSAVARRGPGAAAGRGRPGDRRRRAAGHAVDRGRSAPLRGRRRVERWCGRAPSASAS